MAGIRWYKHIIDQLDKHIKAHLLASLSLPKHLQESQDQHTAKKASTFVTDGHQDEDIGLWLFFLPKIFELKRKLTYNAWLPAKNRKTEISIISNRNFP